MTPPEAERFGLKLTRPLLAVVAVSSLLFFFALGSSRTLTYHEALLAGSAKQMVADGRWLVLYIGDIPRLEKPPLPQWIVAAWAMLLGEFTEGTVRAPFAVFGVLVIVLEMLLMTRLFDARTGLWCGLIQATCVYQITYARLAESDIILQALVLAAVLLFVWREWGDASWTARQHFAVRLGFWTLLGVMNLLKGVGFGAILTVLTCGGWLILRGDARGLKRWWSWTGAALAAVIGLAWPLAVTLYEPGGLSVWNDQILGRATGSLGRYQPIWYYALQWPVQLLPWTPFLFVSAAASWKRARTEPQSADRLLWWWALSHPALLTLSSGKHHHYLIYALPALTPLMVQGLFQTGNALARRLAALQTPSVMRLAGAFAFAVVIIGHLTVQAVVMPRRDPSAADTQFIADVEKQVPATETLTALGGQDVARHVFYLHRPIEGFSQSEKLVPLLHTASPVFVIARGTYEDELRKLGDVSAILQSRMTRRETSASDRYTLFRLTKREGLAESAERHLE